jgi:DNA helicase MCM8
VKNEFGNYVLSLDFQQLKSMCHVEEFYEMLMEKPKIALSCMSAAVHKVCLKVSSVISQTSAYLMLDHSFI